MRLLHLHLPKPISYLQSLQLQEAALQRHYEHNVDNIFRRSKDRRTAQAPSKSESSIPPPPVLLTFETLPTYTVGRRHLKSNPLSQSQIDFLTSASHIPTFENCKESTQSANTSVKLAAFYASPRGGLLTYHAPGQLTAYLIYNLRHHNITPRCHIRLLENAVMATCARHGVLNTLTTADPGVWIGEPAPSLHEILPTTHQCGTNSELRPTSRKICAIGVHVSRGITSHGLGLNVLDRTIPGAHADHYRHSTQYSSTGSSVSGQGTDLAYRSDENATITPNLPPTISPSLGYLSWGFNRIIACGLEGKSVTWISREQVSHQPIATSVEAVGKTLATTLAMGLSTMGSINITAVQGVDETQFRQELARSAGR